jgi:tripartite-type tricarboxylate transporter receptor subunit TctC
MAVGSAKIVAKAGNNKESGMSAFITGLAVALGLSLASAADAQDAYPSRPITIVVGYGAGGSTDIATRIVAAHMEKTLGQPIAIENRVGGNGAVGTSAVNNARPDGYTLAMTSGSILTVMPWTLDLGFDPLKMSFVGSVLESLYALFVRNDAPWRTVGELVDYAKANPNKLVTANSGGWGLPDIGMAQLANAVGGMQYRTVPTSGGGEQVLKLIAGDVQSELNSATPTAPHYRSGAIRALMVVSPAWPELEAKGVPLSSKLYGFSVRNLSALVGPPGLPEPIRQKLEDALKAALDDPALVAQLEKGAGELIRFRTGAQARDDAVQVQTEQKAIGEQLGKVLKK